MKKHSYVPETFTIKQLCDYAKAWGCSVQEAQFKLEKVVVDQAC